MKSKNRKYRVELEFEAKSETIKKGVEFVKKAMKIMRLRVRKIEHIKVLRTDNQNNAAHLWFDQIATEADNRGLTIDLWIKKPTEMRITESMLKDCFREMAKVMFKKDSTAKLTKYEFSETIFFFDKIVLERLGINIEFPNLDLLIIKNKKDE